MRGPSACPVTFQLRFTTVSWHPWMCQGSCWLQEWTQSWPRGSVTYVVKLNISRCQELCSVIYIYHPVVQSSSWACMEGCFHLYPTKKKQMLGPDLFTDYFWVTLYNSAGASIPKDHRLGSLHNRNLFSQLLDLTGSASGKDSVSGYKMAIFSWCPHVRAWVPLSL